jgi:hypothetical protein
VPDGQRLDPSLISAISSGLKLARSRAHIASSTPSGFHTIMLV